MIKLMKHACGTDFQVDLWFSDQTHGHWDATPYLKAHQGPLLEPLRDAGYFRRCFIDAGALCWPNGLELSAAHLRELAAARETV